MTADTLLKQARTEEALESLQSEIKRKPGDAGLRLKLFQVLVVLGQWDRAATQLETALSLNPKLEASADLLGGLLKLERLRASVFSGGETPVIDPPAAWLEELVPGRGAGVGAASARALKAHARALKAAPARGGRIDGGDFAWIADADARFGPATELYSNGRYTWVAFEHVRSIVFKAPDEFVDLVWLPVKLTWRTGGMVAGHIPARYPGTEAAHDANLQLARTVAWKEQGANFLIGTGVRVFSTDQGDFPVTRTGKLEFLD